MGIKIADLFAGVGGIALGFKNAGFDVLWANEIDRKACITYRSNFKHAIIEDDIKNLEVKNLKRIDVLTGGFPCQAFSIAGYRKGFEDERGNLFFEIMRIADVLNPSVLFLENVKNLKNHNKGNTFKVILNELEKRGYFVKYKILNTFEYSDIPQNRERLYIVAFNDFDCFSKFKFPEKIKKTKKISEILEGNVDKSFYYNKSKYYPLLKEKMKNKNSIYQWRRVYLRENKSGVCPTLTANMGTGGHNVPLILDDKDIRKLTPRECFRLQGFPDNFILPDNLAKSALYKQAGNSVSVPIIQKIAENIKKALLYKTQKVVNFVGEGDMVNYVGARAI